MKLIVLLPVTDAETETHLAKPGEEGGRDGERGTTRKLIRAPFHFDELDGRGPETSLFSQICRESSFPRACTYRIASRKRVHRRAETTLSTVEGCHTESNLISYQYRGVEEF